MSNILKNSIISFSFRIAIFIFGFFISVILARALGPTGRGIYALIILIPTIMLRLGSLGIEAASVYFIGSKRYKIQDIVSNSLLSSIVISLTLILIFFGISNLDIFNNFIQANQINLIYLWLVVLTIPFSLLHGFLRYIFLGKEKIVIFNKISIFSTIIQLIAIIIFVLIFRQNIFGAVISYILTNICIAIFVIFLVKKFAKIKTYYNKEIFKESIKYGLKAYFGNLAQFLNYRLDMFLVAIFLTPAAVGYYSISVAMAERIWLLPGAFASVLFPRISSLKSVESNNLTPRISRHTFFITIFLSLILAILAKPLIKLFFGITFLPSLMPLLILLPGIIALSVSKILTADLAGRGKPQYGTYSSFVSLALNVPLNLWLIPRWGISGAAFATTVAYTLSTLLVINFFIKISKKSCFEILVIKRKDLQDYKKLLVNIKNKIVK